MCVRVAENWPWRVCSSSERLSNERDLGCPVVSPRLPGSKRGKAGWILDSDSKSFLLHVSQALIYHNKPELTHVPLELSGSGFKFATDVATLVPYYTGSGFKWSY